jgi:hypothetical protein
MNWLMEWIAFVIGWLRNWFGLPYRAIVRHGSLPSRHAPATVYLLHEDGEPWHASMICPCGCGATLEMNLLPDEKPVWTAAVEPDGSATLHPSVWRKVGCKSHFFVRKGRIVWCDSVSG